MLKPITYGRYFCHFRVYFPCECQPQVLHAMAKSLGDMVSSCGGPTQGHILLEPLEHLCSAGETVVRDEATKSAKIIISMITAESVRVHAHVAL